VLTQVQYANSFTLKAHYYEAAQRYKAIYTKLLASRLRKSKEEGMRERKMKDTNKMEKYLWYDC
jgi:DNA-binding HxlR family transcriptional regulator